MSTVLEPTTTIGAPATLRVALAGNPNSGKTSLFNALTGSRQRVGNYAGVTVEKRVGHRNTDANRLEFLDLPGTYSLSSYSPEERVAQEELLRDDLDVVVVVADSTLLRRSLVLLAQIMQTGNRVVLCLNMADEAEQAGQRLDLGAMEELLGIPVVSTVAHRRLGMPELVDAIERATSLRPVADRVVLGDRLHDAIAAVAAELPSRTTGRDWRATRLLAGDEGVLDGAVPRNAADVAAAQRVRLEAETGREVSVYLMEQYFGFVDGLLTEVTLRPQRADARAFSDAVDRVAVNRWLGLPLFAAAIYGIFWLTFTVGALPMEWIESGFAWLAGVVDGLWAPGSESPLRSLLVDGIIGGVGGVLVFLPNVVLLFLGLAILEDTGYMARAAFLMDRVMHRFGLHGKSFMPMVTGFGCSIPGIMATRTLENERDRLTTMLVLPLMSCGARLPIWLLLVPAFFAPQWQAPALFGIYAFGVLAALTLALVLRKSVLRGDDAPFVMELPPYRVPTLRGVLTRIGDRAWIYLRKAGTIILAISILMWAITAYPKKDVYDVDAAVEAGTVQLTDAQIENARAAEDLRFSIAGRIGHAMAPVIEPLGFDWKMGTAMVGAFAAKEVFVSQMGIVYSMGETDEESTSLREAIRSEYSIVTGISLILFLLISTPCMATIAVTRRESGRWRWALLQLGGLTVVAYLVSLTVSQVGRLLV
jgi:ferrous iron transport protein B